MIQKSINEQEYANIVSEDLRYKLYYGSILADAAYSIFFDLHDELSKNNLHLDKKLISNYKRLSSLVLRLRDCLHHLAPGASTDSQTDLILAVSQIEESLIRKFLNVIMTAFTEDLSIIQKLDKVLKKYQKTQLLEAEDLDFNSLVKALNVDPEKQD